MYIQIHLDNKPFDNKQYFDSPGTRSEARLAKNRVTQTNTSRHMSCMKKINISNTASRALLLFFLLLLLLIDVFDDAP